MKIKIHDSVYIFLLLAFLSGYFEYMFLLLLIIFVHESGHYLFSKIIHFKYQEIIIYPFGGITKYNEDLNISTNKELFVLLGGIVFQVLFFLLVIFLYNNHYITLHVYKIIYRINYILISFNFMLILPLDGGKLLNIILDKLLPYRISNIVSIVISIIFIIIFFIKVRSFLSVLLVIFLLKSVILELKESNYKFNKFILERYLNDYKFKHIKKVNSIYDFKRDYTHIVNNVYERDFLHILFDRNSQIC